MRVATISALLFFLFASLLFAGTTGKIAGVVTDAKSGEKLVAATVIIDGTTMGASTNIDGYYVILNVPPGTYRIKASLVGYSPATVIDVRVNIDLTTTIDLALNEEAITTKEVVVVAPRPVVKKDVSSSQANLNYSEFENLPVVTNVSNIMGLQAGIQISQTTGDIIIRGGGADQTAIMVDGYALRDERTNKSFMSVSLSSIEDIQIQTGGFNAEYGNIRSGVVNMVMKEGSAQKYTVAIIGRYSAPAPKFFGPGPSDLNSYWIRPYTDDAVCWTGTKNGAWDEFTQKQYPYFEGWYSVSQKSMSNNNPDDPTTFLDDLTPEGAQRVFLWQHRRDLNITKPDWDADASFGGPVPVIGQELGNLRFHASFRQVVSQYLFPLSRDANNDWSGQLKLTSDVGPGMKLMAEALYGENFGTNNNNAGLAGLFTTPASIANVINRVNYIDARIFATDYWGPSIIKTTMYGAKFTHVLTPETFYETSLHKTDRKYSTMPGRLRDITKKYQFGTNYFIDESPFGFQPAPSTGIDGLRMGVGFSGSRDSSEVTSWTAKFDVSSQLNQYNQVKAGVEFIFIDNNVNYANYDAFLPRSGTVSRWNTFPKRAAVYAQDKIEFEGMIANVGIRLDYSHAGGKWYDYGTNFYDKAFSGDKSLGMDTLLKMTETEPSVTVSPRLGVSFPVTENSKLYFNYGHFYSMPTPENLYMVRRSSFDNQVLFVADPNKPLPRTVAYELGYEQSFFDQFLVRIAGYYKNVTDQATTTQYTNKDGSVNYSRSTADSYEDIRGIEFTLNKNRGDWVTGFVNYTYEVSTSGRFGFAQYYDNPVRNLNYQTDPTNIENDLYQYKPEPRPYGRANLDFFTPSDYELGPMIGTGSLAADWRLSLVGTYLTGQYFTWVGGGATTIPGLRNNVKWKDYYSLDLRLSKTIKFEGMSIQLFMDMSNALNLKYFSDYGWFDGNDRDAYLKSLHLPADVGDRLDYGNIPGDDSPGDYREEGVTPVQIKSVVDLASEKSPSTTALYYDRSTKTYMKYVNNQWVAEDKSKVDQILEDKAYIDMPNLGYLTFLNPRHIYFGIHLTLEIR